MAPEQEEHTWTSVLPITEQVVLSAAQGEPWTEQWQVEVGPVWHVEHTGLPTVRQGEAGLREWRPWPGPRARSRCGWWRRSAAASIPTWG